VLRVSRILHAGYVLSCAGIDVALDPIFENPFSTNCHAFPDVRFDHDQVRQLRFAAVFISHFHEDHCSLESLALLDRDTPIYVFCVFDELRELIRALGFTSVHALELDTPVIAGPFEVIPRRALDEDVDSMFHIRAAGLEVLNVVDAWIHPSTLGTLVARAPWDLVLWPFQTMRELEVLSPSRSRPSPGTLPEEYLEQLAALRPAIVVPSSCQFSMEPWSWYNASFFPITYRQFERELSELLPTTRVLRLDPGVSVDLDGRDARPAPRLSWVEPVGPQDVDYGYDPTLVPPSTATIARALAPTTQRMISIVREYCRSGLIERYRTLEPPSEGYFSKKPRLWRLSIFDDRGEVTQFSYRVEGSSITPAEHGPPSWWTEVPLVKLYAALEQGESLTSMYVRINDVRFDDAVEAELADADVLEDPLIRALFEGVFGAYPRAQLARLRG
jgi:hypothetical protein